MDGSSVSHDALDEVKCTEDTQRHTRAHRKDEAYLTSLRFEKKKIDKLDKRVSDDR